MWRDRDRDRLRENCELYYALIIDAQTVKNIKKKKIKTKLKGGKLGFMRDKENINLNGLNVFLSIGRISRDGTVRI